MFSKIRKLSQTQMIVTGYLSIIFIGTLLLLLPFSKKAGMDTGFVDTLFTATSATCVTGLVVTDTFQNWTLFGQLIILVLIQTGGLGFMTVGVLFAIALRRKIGLKTRGVIQESVNTLQIGGIVKLVKRILRGTLLFEGVGAALLSIRFIQDYGVLRGIYFGIFHSVSAFCNAGFDLFGINEEYSSLVAYRNDYLVNIVIIFLVVIGGIGFLVWDDVIEHKWRFKEYRLHSKIVFMATGVLIAASSVLFFVFEWNGTLSDLPMSEKIIASIFAAVTPRTAGFNTLDLAAMQGPSKLLTMILMFIGGNPGSTAGGIKTTTIVVLIVALRSNIKKINSHDIFNRRLDDENIIKAILVFCTNLFIAIGACLIIGAIQKTDMLDIGLEVFSAIGTVGLSTGITRELTLVSKIIVIFLMYCGRVGSLSFALSFNTGKQVVQVKQVAEKILVG